MLGTRGVPAQYGGFETAVEEIGRRLVDRGFDVTVYCRNPGQRRTEYLGMRLVNLPAVRHRFTETLSHTAFSSAHAIAVDRPDVALLMNAGNAPLLKPLQALGIPTAINIDGLESRREKWRGAGARYYRWAEGAAVRWATEVIADSSAIADHVRVKYGRDCTVIAYGADVIHPGGSRLAELGLEPGGYHLVVARIEPENHVLEAVHAYRASDERRPLVVVGSAPYSQWYIERIREAAGDDARINLVGAVYDAELLNQLYANARTYIHGHSVGGTNPSLLRAMGAGAPVLAIDVEFSREVTDGDALFWEDADALTQLIDEVSSPEADRRLAELSRAGRDRVLQHYQWDAVAAQYAALIERLGGSR
jgi:glycosyltransferase involved in cell wall biosynthesis